MKELVHYEFHGMDPSEWTESFLDDELMPLLAWAPRRSTLRLRVDRFNSSFNGKLIIYSQGSAFVVEGEAGDITALCMTLKKRMKTKLQKWKSTHHHHPISRAG